ncbi:M28 family peptidase [Aminipila butyrica]|uniref:M28 family peptidase n=1 Tax=Aminipila butyrica TaxID=433296 RepID=A0A858BZ60_9FIRM|nr:M28 family peptidase [Aminipila butyrica]QIB70425.1 M28 family peptidase [Aminipila butyrica]
MLKKKLAALLAAAVMLTSSVPMAFAGDTGVDSGQPPGAGVSAADEGSLSGGEESSVPNSEGDEDKASEKGLNSGTEGTAVDNGEEVPGDLGTPSEEELISPPAITNEAAVISPAAIINQELVVDRTKESVMYRHLTELSQTIGPRLAGSDAEKAAGDYIKDTLQAAGYAVEVQPFHWEVTNKSGIVVKEGDSSNLVAIKQGKSAEEVIVGAHYDSVNTAKGASDNASGVSVMLAAAEALKGVETDYTIRFVAFGAEEVGLKGSTYYANKMDDTDIDNTIAMINLDTVLFGDKMYAYGSLGKDSWLCRQALDLADRLDLDVVTQQGLNEAYPKGTTGDWSDHAPFRKLGLPWLYFESTNWDLLQEDGTYSEGDRETKKFGEIMHTKRDSMEFMDENYPERMEDRLYTYTTLLIHLLDEINPNLAEDSIVVNTDRLSMSEKGKVEVSVEFTQLPDLADLEWTFGGKAFEQWKVIKCEGRDGRSTKEETEIPFITFAEEPKVEGDRIVASLEFNLPFGTENLSLRPYPRRIYTELLGQYDLAVTDSKSGRQVETSMTYNAFDSYHQQLDIKPEVENIIRTAREDRYLEYAPLGKSAEGRDIPFVILSREESDIDKYFSQTLPMMLNSPGDFLAKIEAGTADGYKPVIWFNNIHSDEANGVDAQLDLLRKLSRANEITFESASKTEKDAGGKIGQYETGDTDEFTLDVQELLDQFIIVFSLNNNPDGRHYNTRETASGFDPNRDVTYQTQVETEAVFQALAKWSPMICNDFHGFVADFLIEPCTPPHDPNFEYDLLMAGAIPHANAMGKSGIANTKYDHYIIPLDDYKDGWDDGAPMYAAVLAQMHGALGHTIEVPELNQESNNAFLYAGLGSLNYALENRKQLFSNQLEIYRRGVENEDSPKVDSWLINAAGEAVGRQREQNNNFFPEYYVLPVSGELQKNPLAAYEMAEFLINNGIRVEKTSEAVQIGSTTYPAGSFLVSMHQAKRGLANCVLYDGSDFSDFAAMYAEVTMCFPQLRGFDKYEVRTAGAFEGKTVAVEQVRVPAMAIPSGTVQLVIKNTNNDAVKAVNELLKNNLPVAMTYSAGEGFNKGDFIVDKKDVEAIKDKYFLELSPFKGKASVKSLRQSNIAAVGDEMRYVLQGLGFQLLPEDTYGGADVIADDSSYSMTSDMKQAIQGGTSYVAVGAYGMSALQNSGLLPGFKMGGFDDYYEGVLRADLNTDSVITGRYNEKDILYNNTGSWIESAPATAKVLGTISEQADFYVAGWWPNHQEVKGKTYIMQDQAGNAKITAFASHITNKAHNTHQFRLLSNAIYDSLPGALTEITGYAESSGKSGSKNTSTNQTYKITVSAGKGGTISPASASVAKGSNQNFSIKADKGYVIADVTVDGKSVGAVSTYKFNSVTAVHSIKATFKQSGDTSTENKANWTFKDVSASSWFHASVDYVLQKGIMKGMDSQTFGPNMQTDRAMIVTMLYRLEGQPAGGTAAFPDVAGGVWYSEPVAWANGNGLVTGYENGQFQPSKAITREQLASILYRYAGYKKLDTTGKGNLASFHDQGQISAYAKEAVTWAIGTGLMNGKSSGQLDPKGTATRAEVAAMFQRLDSLMD